MHRAMEIMGACAAMRAGTEIQALAFTADASRGYMSTFRRDGGSVKAQLDPRDTTFGDYRAGKDRGGLVVPSRWSSFRSD